MKLILVRHGETHWNSARRTQGSSDIELNHNGIEQTKSVALALAKEPIQAVYSSPLRRAFVTAEAIASPHSLEVSTKPGLAELCQGEIEGLTFEEIKSNHGEFLKEWFRDPSSVRIPGGECLSELQERAWAVVEELMPKHPQETVVAVSHSFAILTIICRAIGLELVNLRRLRQGVTGISVLTFDEAGPHLNLFNDICHLKV